MVECDEPDQHLAKYFPLDALETAAASDHGLETSHVRYGAPFIGVDELAMLECSGRSGEVNTSL